MSKEEPRQQQLIATTTESSSSSSSSNNNNNNNRNSNSNDDDVSNQLRHQQTSALLLNHQDHPLLKQSSDTVLQSSSDRAKATAAVTESFTPTASTTTTTTIETASTVIAEQTTSATTSNSIAATNTITDTTKTTTVASENNIGQQAQFNMAMHNIGPNSMNTQSSTDSHLKNSPSSETTTTSIAASAVATTTNIASTTWHPNVKSSDNINNTNNNNNNNNNNNITSNNNNNNTSDVQATSKPAQQQPPATTSPSNSAFKQQAAAILQSQQQNNQQFGILNPQIPASLQSGLDAAKIEQVIRSSLQNSPAYTPPTSNNSTNTNSSNSTTTTGGSSQLHHNQNQINPLTSLPSSASSSSSSSTSSTTSASRVTTAAAVASIMSNPALNFLGPHNILQHGATASSMSSPINSFHGSTSLTNFTGDTSTTTIAPTSKIPAHSASQHSSTPFTSASSSSLSNTTATATTGLASLNNQSHHIQRQQQLAAAAAIAAATARGTHQVPPFGLPNASSRSSTSSSSSLIPQAAHGNNHPPKLGGFTSTTSSDHHNHIHMPNSVANALPSLPTTNTTSNQSDNIIADFSSRLPPMVGIGVGGGPPPSSSSNKNMPPFPAPPNTRHPPFASTKNWPDYVNQLSNSSNIGQQQQADNVLRLPSIHGINTSTPSSISQQQQTNLAGPSLGLPGLGPGGGGSSGFGGIGGIGSPAGGTLGSNFMIGSDGDNLLRINTAMRADQRFPSLPINNNNNHNKQFPNFDDTMLRGPHPNLSSFSNNTINLNKQSYPGLEHFKVPFAVAEAALRVQQSQQARSSVGNCIPETVAIFALNLTGQNIPGTSKPKQVILNDTDMRTSIEQGELYTKHEHVVIGILTNQVQVPGFNIADYLSRDKFPPHEMDKIEFIHSRIEPYQLICLMEFIRYKHNPRSTKPQNTSCEPNKAHLPHQASSLSATATANPTIDPPVYRSGAMQRDLISNTQQQQQMSAHTRGNLSSFSPLIGAGSRLDHHQTPHHHHHHHPQQQQHNFTNHHHHHLDSKSRQSPQSPGLDGLRSHQHQINMNLSHPSRPMSGLSLTGNPTFNPNQHSDLPLSINPMMPPPNYQAKTPSGNMNPQMQPHMNRSSPFQAPLHVSTQPSVSRPPRSHSTIGVGLSDTPSGMQATSTSIRQPPAAHQSSSRPSLPTGLMDLSAGPLHQQHPPVAAHMSSKTPQTPKLHQQESPSKHNLKGSPQVLNTHQSNLGSKSIGLSGPRGSLLGPNYMDSFNPHNKMSELDGGHLDMPMHSMMGCSGLPRQQDSSSMKRAITPQFPPHSLAGGPLGGGQPNIFSPRGFDPPRLGLDHGLRSPPPSNSAGPLDPYRMPGSMPPLGMPPHHMSVTSPQLHNQYPIRGPSSSTPPPPRMKVSDDDIRKYNAFMSWQAQARPPFGDVEDSVISSYGTGLHQPPPPTHQSQLYPPTLQQLATGSSSDQQMDMQHKIQSNSPKQNQRSIITGSASSNSASSSKKSKKSKTSPTININNNQQQQHPQQAAGSGESDLPMEMGQKGSLSAVTLTTPSPLATNTIGYGASHTGPINLNPMQTTSAVDSPDPNDQLSRLAAAAAAAVPASNQTAMSQSVKQTSSSISNNNNAVVSQLPLSAENPAARGEKLDAPAMLACQTTSDNNVNDNINNSSEQSPIRSDGNNPNTSVTPVQETRVQEPSKYQKIFTKKAWLKNYDQEDQAKVLESTASTAAPSIAPDSIASDSSTMGVKVKTEIDNNSIEDTTKDSEPKENLKASVKTNGGSKTSTSKSSRVNPKKKRKVERGKSSSLSSLKKTKVPATKGEHDSEETNVSTSELDDTTDDADSVKSGSNKRLRRMPRRKAKVGSDREASQTGAVGKPLSASANKDPTRKRPKKEKTTTPATAMAVNASDNDSNLAPATKRKCNSDDESAKQQQKSRKIKDGKTEDKVSACDKTADSKSPKKRPGEKFLQTCPCYDVVPKSIRCMECRRVRQSSLKGDRIVPSKQASRTNWDDFCRFYEFRKLRYNKSNQIVVAGFSEMSDAKETDMKLWLPNTKEVPENFTYDDAKFILTKVGVEFCNLVLRERAVQREYELRSDDKKVTWKKAVNGLRELCDVCSTTLFNCHFVCERCGFVVCIDCYQIRARQEALEIDDGKIEIKKENTNNNDSNEEQPQGQTPAKKSKKDSIGWMYCAKNEGHSTDRMILARIIAGDCLEEVWKLLHEMRARLNLGPCTCNSFDFQYNEDSQEDDSKQVSAAIEECIASLSPKYPFEETTQGDIKSTSNNADPVSSTLCDGDLLVLHQPRNSNNIKLFRGHWKQGKPVLVRGIHKLMGIERWLPHFFAVEFGDYRSDLVDCRNGDIHRQSMKKYWDGFEPSFNPNKKKAKDETVPTHIGSASNEEPSAITTAYYCGAALWRLKDWPPGQDFNEILPEHYHDFMKNLPLESYTTRTGKLNLACRLPKEMLKPDLGPKMYSAYGTTKFPERGTTNLHLDISDAINVMVYVGGANSYDSGPTECRDMFEKTIEDTQVDEVMKNQIRESKLIPGALWHLFRPSDASEIRVFLNKVADERKISPEKRTDPIHDQIWYLDQPLLDRLFKEHGVKSYPILQCMGDAILIPAGAPHQVKNLQNCIKVANDFVSPENVHWCLKLTDEFRRLPETHINQEDKLQIKNILYHSVKESLQYLKMSEVHKLEDNQS